VNRKELVVLTSISSEKCSLGSGAHLAQVEMVQPSRLKQSANWPRLEMMPQYLKSFSTNVSMRFA
jgi:hypothetical protein